MATWFLSGGRGLGCDAMGQVFDERELWKIFCSRAGGKFERNFDVLSTFEILLLYSMYKILVGMTENPREIELHGHVPAVLFLNSQLHFCSFLWRDSHSNSTNDSIENAFETEFRKSNYT